MTIASKVLSVRVVAALGATTVLACAAPAARATPIPPHGFTLTTFAGAPTGTPPIKGPDDVAFLGGHVFVGWQNGVGPKGEPNPTTGQAAGTVVEYDLRGTALARWSLRGKVDGIGADPGHSRLIVTVNEDGKSSLYTISPTAHPAVQHYKFSPTPDLGTPTGGVHTGGGTDAVSVLNGHIYLSASNPGTPKATAVFEARPNPHTGVATLSATFADNSTATDAVTGQKVTLSLTDPDSNAIVSPQSPRFAGDFVLAAQGDQQLVFARNLGSAGMHLTRLKLTHGAMSAGVDDLRWTAGDHGTLIVLDNKTNTVYAVTGPFKAGQAFASLDTVGTTVMTHEVDKIDLRTGALSPFITGLGTAKGLLWIP